MEEFKLYRDKGYQFVPQEFFQAGALDTEDLKDEESETVNMSVFSLAASHKPLTPQNYKFMMEMIQSRAVIPDRQFERHLFDKDENPLYRYDAEEKLYIWFPWGEKKPGVPESQILARAPVSKDEEKIPLQGLSSIAVREKDYERYKNLMDDLDFVQANEILQEKRKQQLKSLVIAEPESNISTISSDICPFGKHCTTKNCVRKHDKIDVPEAMCGAVNIPHYPDDLRTDFAYPIFKKGSIKKEGVCYLTPLGFIGLKHVPKDKPLSDFYIQIGDSKQELESIERFPEQHGFDKRVLHKDFQDNIVIKIKDHYKIVKSLSSARTSLPRAGLEIMVITVGSNNNVRTETSILREDSETGMYLINTNNNHGDSGSPVIDIAKKTVIGTYWGAKKEGNKIIGNYVLPLETTFVAAINGNQKFQLAKNFNPSL